MRPLVDISKAEAAARILIIAAIPAYGKEHHSDVFFVTSPSLAVAMAARRAVPHQLITGAVRHAGFGYIRA
ncbi:MAG TPA: hypothetical protein VFZ73_07960 [Gemmatimonadaceae bacterium]